MYRPESILLLGPTGSGKSPLGDLLERRGLWGRRCRHFDFGQALRRAAESRAAPPGLSDADVAFVRDVLLRGALLEDEHFRIAEALLRAFIAERGVREGDLVVLNGLPRHESQARAVESIVRVVAVVDLDCAPQAVLERIRTNAGGDRNGRRDDDDAAVLRKLDLYRRRTAPLREHYARCGASMLSVSVRVTTTPQDMWHALDARRPGPDGQAATGAR